ncbi:MAG: hypothetical protein EPO09_06735 [Aquabacterium sp.]|uniref:hypothetical protein n=1 Tax=Aquabacterium sp. TaxID=1872578 RepID=UPI00120444D1|nr:hypothetical protein [Aquabacterium sp.]TAK96080.1 MAG: hypothetical protein EPO09_06735 [Aquabacterium sp.]
MMNRCTPSARMCLTKFFGLAGIAMLLTAWLPMNPAQAAASDTQVAKPSQTWRCKAPSGQINYSQQACPEGGELLTLKDARSHGQHKQASNNLERDAKLARRMQRERRHEERMAAKENAISLSGKGGPHVIQSTPNTHDPVPVSDMSKPIRIKPMKKAATSSAQPSSGNQSTAF